MVIIEDRRINALNTDFLNKNTSISYSGDITLTTYIGKTAISKKQYHNKGALALYRFLANCLSGNFPAAYQLRPFQIKLLSYTGDKNPNEFKIDQALMEGSIQSVTNFINLASAPEIKYVYSDTTCGCSVTFSFIFPYDRLSSTENGANVVAIYGPGIQDTAIGDFCAYYLLTSQVVNIAEGSDTETVLTWDPIIKKADEEETNKVLAVEWTMNLNNKI